MPSKLIRNKENKSLPSRWRFKHGAYYFRVPEGLTAFWGGKREFRLGKTLDEAYRTWAEKLESQSNAKTMSEMFDRYALEIIPHKAARSQESNIHSLSKLRPFFGRMLITSVKPIHVYQYLDLRGREGKKAANMDHEVLSHCFTKAIKWGLVESHPIIKNVEKFSTPARTNYVEDWQLEEALKVASPFVKTYVNLKMLTGLRQGDMLSIKISDLKNDGIHVTPRKTANSSGKSLIIEWTPELKNSINEIMKIRKKVSSIWLFHTYIGNPYIKVNGKTCGFKSIWKRFMDKALKETNLDKRFPENDLRAKVASDDDDIAHASKLLGHTTEEITKRVYRRRPERVKPAR